LNIIKRFVLFQNSSPFDLRHETGPFDIIGDVHGCSDELETLLDRLGYRVSWSGTGVARSVATEPPPGRRAVFVGDLVDRGPRSPDALRIVISLCRAGHAFMVPGNHDMKFWRWLKGNKVTLTHGLERTVEQFQFEPRPFRQEVASFIDALPPYLWLDGGRLAIAHAGIKADMIGDISNSIRYFCVYGDTDGKADSNGIVIRYNWASTYSSDTTVIYGHIPVTSPTWLNNTCCIDTGCCFGGELTALRWPERDIVSVPAQQKYWQRARDFGLPQPRDLLD
jgi:protein phosphatase